MNNFTVQKGADYSVDLELRDPVGNAITIYTAGDVLSARVWLGGSNPEIFNPEVDWVDATAGTFTLSFGATDTAALDPGVYLVDINLTTASGRFLDVLDGQLTITAAPGTAMALSVYATANDALLYFPELLKASGGNCGDSGSLVTDRSPHFHLARTWLDKIIQKKYRIAYSQTYGYPSPFGRPFAYDFNMLGESPWLQDQLDADNLILRADVIEATAKRAIGTILESKIGLNDGDSNYQRLAAKFLAEANNIVMGMVAEIAIDGNTNSVLTIPCGMASIR
jgi:hypothetical protein